MPERTLERLDRLERFFEENRDSLEDDGDYRGADILTQLLADIRAVRLAVEPALFKAAYEERDDAGND